MVTDLKVFQIGFNKCATRSISHFFKRHGCNVLDWAHGDIAKQLKLDIEEGRKPLEKWSDVNVFTDMEYTNAQNMIEGYRYFRELHAAYPDALFILNTRHGEEWIRSRHAHGSGAYTDAYRRHYGFDNAQQVFSRWRFEWHRHHSDVLEYFSGNRAKKFFVWDINTPDFEGLQDHLDFEINQGYWSQRGVTANAPVGQ